MRARAKGRAPSLPRLEIVSDERLVARLRSGDRRAFEAIYDRYERPILSFCRHMLGQREDADDAAQHVFLSAYRHIVQTSKPIDLRPWLFTIARNRCRSVLRSRYRAMAFSEGMEQEPSVEGLGAEVERREQLQDLLRDIARLPEDQRAALLLAQLAMLRHDEVAQVLGVPPDKVKALVFQARSSLLASQEARETPCREIREQLATQTGAALRRTNLRRHLRDCSGCRDFESRLRAQRNAVRALLPIAGAPAIRDAVVGHAAGGAGAGAAAGAGAGGAVSGVVAKFVTLQVAAAVSVAAAGAGVAVVEVHQAAAHPDPAPQTRLASTTFGVASPMGGRQLSSGQLSQGGPGQRSGTGPVQAPPLARPEGGPPPGADAPHGAGPQGAAPQGTAPQAPAAGQDRAADGTSGPIGSDHPAPAPPKGSGKAGGNAGAADDEAGEQGGSDPDDHPQGGPPGQSKQNPPKPPSPSPPAALDTPPGNGNGTGTGNPPANPGGNAPGHGNGNAQGYPTGNGNPQDSGNGNPGGSGSGGNGKPPQRAPI